MDGWNTTFLFGRPIFRGELLVSGRVVKTEIFINFRGEHVPRQLEFFLRNHQDVSRLRQREKTPKFSESCS